MGHWTKFEKWYGRDEPPLAFSKLKAGPYDLEFENGDLRYIRWQGMELIRRIYVAIRDVNWNTIPALMTQPNIQLGEDHFSIKFSASHTAGPLKFQWQASIQGSPDGTIEYVMDGVALCEFRYCRIGFCVLHPVQGIAGSLYTAETPGGQISGVLPELVEPQWIVDGFETAIFPACTSLTVQTPAGVKITTAFEGDLFETEDQRNWTDGSFKTYCTPIALGYPHKAAQGQSFLQKVTLRFDTPVGIESHAAPADDQINHIEFKTGGEHTLPKIGFGIQDQSLNIDNDQGDLLSRLNPSHLKAEIHFEDSNWKTHLDRAISISHQLGSPLELALFLNNDPGDALEEMKINLAGAALARFIVFNEHEAPNGTTSPSWVEAARRHLAAAASGVKFYGGTNGNFAELNRQQPDISVMDGVAYTINPQVHAFDERSLVENIEGQRYTVLTARSYSANLPIAVSSVTLKPPFNQAATEDETPPDPHDLPDAVDQRQMSLFGAAWTVGSLASLISGGADSVTYYQTSGWLGLMETRNGSLLPDKFRSSPGMVYPLYYVFEFLADSQNGRPVALDIEKPLNAQALAVQIPGKFKLAVANLLPEYSTVNITSLPAGEASIRHLNTNTYETAVSQPEAFLDSAEDLAIINGEIGIQLMQYETAFIVIQLE